MVIYLFDFIVVPGIHTRDERHREESDKTDGAQGVDQWDGLSRRIQPRSGILSQKQQQ